MTIVALTFVAVTGIVLGIYAAFVAVPEGREQARLRGRLKGEAMPTTEARVQLLKAPEKLSDIPFVHELLLRFPAPLAPLKQLLDESGAAIKLGPFVQLSIMAALLVTAAVQLRFRLGWPSLVAGLLTGVVPVAVLRFMRTRRLSKFEEQFPEAVDLIARALRAGHAFPTGIQMVADELPPPAGPEFKLLYERQNYGAQLPDALRTFAQRIPLIDARFFVTAVLTQRESGGNLSEVLDRLASVMRERFRIRRDVSVRSAHGRITAYVLAAMPPALAGMMFINSPDQLQILTSDPLGVRMILAGVVLEVIGVLVIRRLVDIEY